MKKIFYLLGAAGFAVLSSCSNDPVGDPDPMQPQKLGNHTIEALTPAADETRTHLGPQNGNYSPVFWSENDALAVVTDQGALCKYLLTDGKETQNGTFTVSGTPTAEGAANLTAYYPYSAYDGGKMSIPAAQTYVNGTFAPDTNPMYAETTGDGIGTLQFSHLAGVINIRLTDDGTGRQVKSIRLLSSDKTLSGAGTLVEGPDGNKILVYASGTESMEHLNEEGAPATTDTQDGLQITLTCAEPVTLNEQTPMDFIFVVPAQTYPAGTLSFEITDAADKTVTKTLGKQLVVGRAKIIDFTAIAIPKVVVAESAEKVADAIKEALTATPEEAPEVVQVSSTVNTDAEVTIPKVFAEAAALTVEVPNVSTNTQLTFKESNAQEETGKLPKQVHIVTDAQTAKKLVIDMPNTTVTVNGKYTEMTASTADNTLNVDENAEVDQLTLLKGNVNVYGTVSKIVKGSGYSGTVIGCIATQAGLERILANQELYDRIVIDKAVTGLDGKNKTLTKPLEVAADAELSNLTISPASTSEATHPIDVNGNGVKAVFDNLLLVCNTAKSYGIHCTGVNPDVTIRNSEIKALGTDCRGISIFNKNLTSTDSHITIDNTSIHCNETALGNVTYTEDQVKYFTERVKDTNYYPRGIAVNNNGGKVRIDLLNGSAVEGFFYAVNIPSLSTPVTVNVEKSRLDGRAALNVHGKECVFNVRNSVLVGRNYFIGPTEVFATIVLDYASESNTVTVTDSEIYSYNSPQTATNQQFSVDVRSNNNTLRLLGSTKLVEVSSPQPARMSCFVVNHGNSNTIEVDSGVTVEGKTGAHVLPNTLWDGTTATTPILGGGTIDGTKWDFYEIHEASDLAWIAQKANAGELEDGYGVIFFNDIDLGNQKWSPIGLTGLTNPNDAESNYTAKGHLFSGCVLGNGHTIRNVKIEESTPARGIFGQVYGSDSKPVIIADLNAENVVIKGEGKWTGGLVGYVRNVALISNCSVKDVEIACGDTFHTYGSGGLLGYVSNNSDLTIDDCSSENVAFTGKGGWNNGGLIGKFYGNKKVTVSNCNPAKGYFRTSLAVGETLNGLTTGGIATTVKPYIAYDGYQSSWFIGNITAQNGFDLKIENITDNSANWEAKNAQGADLKEQLRAGAYVWPYVGVYDGYNKNLTGTLTIDNKLIGLKELMLLRTKDATTSNPVTVTLGLTIGTTDRTVEIPAEVCALNAACTESDLSGWNNQAVRIVINALFDNASATSSKLIVKPAAGATYKGVITIAGSQNKNAAMNLETENMNNDQTNLDIFGTEWTSVTAG